MDGLNVTLLPSYSIRNLIGSNVNSESPPHPHGHRCTTVLYFILMYKMPGTKSVPSVGMYSTNFGVIEFRRLRMLVPFFSIGRCSRSGIG